MLKRFFAHLLNPLIKKWKCVKFRRLKVNHDFANGQKMQSEKLTNQRRATINKVNKVLRETHNHFGVWFYGIKNWVTYRFVNGFIRLCFLLLAWRPKQILGNSFDGKVCKMIIESNFGFKKPKTTKPHFGTDIYKRAQICDIFMRFNPLRLKRTN